MESPNCNMIITGGHRFAKPGAGTDTVFFAAGMDDTRSPVPVSDPKRRTLARLFGDDLDRAKIRESKTHAAPPAHRPIA